MKNNNRIQGNKKRKWGRTFASVPTLWQNSINNLLIEFVICLSKQNVRTRKIQIFKWIWLWPSTKSTLSSECWSGDEIDFWHPTLGTISLERMLLGELDILLLTIWMPSFRIVIVDGDPKSRRLRSCWYKFKRSVSSCKTFVISSSISCLSRKWESKN